MAEEAKACSHPHVLLFPFPAQGHVPPMLKLAELLSSAGGDLHVTFVNTENIHNRFLQRSPAAFHSLSRHPNFRFRPIPDGLPEDDPRPIFEFLKLEDSLRTRSRERFRQLLNITPSSDVDKWPPVTCVITDGMIRMAFEVSDECCIPVMIFRTSSPESVWAYYSMPQLIRTGNLPFPEKADMDELISGVGELVDLNLRRRDLPGLLRHIKSVDDPMLKYLMSMGRDLPRARALILNTTENLGSKSLPHIRSVCPVTYTVGPLQLMQETLIGASDDQSAKNVSLWKEDRSCMNWLDRQPDKSVIYVSSGSVTIMSTDAFVEFRHTLVDSGHRFLWVVRPDMVQGEVDEYVSTDKSCVVEWAPQEEVLSHRAVGCFVTHSGWNSTLESIVAGVPMICWPFFADQQTNSRFVSEVWKVGIDMKDVSERSVIEAMIRRAMDGEEAEMLRERASEVGREVRKSVVKGGSSYENFRKLVEHIKSFSR